MMKETILKILTLVMLTALYAWIFFAAYNKIEILRYSYIALFLLFFISLAALMFPEQFNKVVYKGGEE